MVVQNSVEPDAVSRQHGLRKLCKRWKANKSTSRGVNLYVLWTQVFGSLKCFQQIQEKRRLQEPSSHQDKHHLCESWAWAGRQTALFSSVQCLWSSGGVDSSASCITTAPGNQQLSDLSGTSGLSTSVRSGLHHRPLSA